MWVCAALTVVASSAALGVDGELPAGVLVGPRVSGTLPRPTEGLLRKAFARAVQAVHDNPDCRALFGRLGADAIERLTTSIYYPTTAEMESRVCRRGAATFTYVGSPQVRLCRRFASLGVERAATLLIHEALHWAGVSEHPLDPNSLYGRDITRLVSQACALRRGVPRPSDRKTVARQTTEKPRILEHANPSQGVATIPSWDTSILGSTPPFGFPGRLAQSWVGSIPVSIESHQRLPIR